MGARIVLASSTLLVVGVLLMAPGVAHAQYKNSAFGFDAGYWWVWKPSLEGVAIQNTPLRLSMGGRIGGEYNFKLSADHWWLSLRLNIGLLSFLPATGSEAERIFDQNADATVGVVMSIQGMLGIRYVFLTDRFRPYIQLALSYTPLFGFQSEADCTVDLCDNTSASAYDVYLRQQHIGAIHAQPGIEWIIQRDLALHFFVDTQLWLVFNTTPNVALVPTVGVLFFM